MRGFVQHTLTQVVTRGQEFTERVKRTERSGSHPVYRIHERMLMIPLLYVAAGISLASIIVAVCAWLTAPDGFEDEQGFHAIRTGDTLESPEGSSHGDANEPPYLSAH